MPGYEYKLQVVGSSVEDTPADASSIQWSLVRVESYTSTSGKPNLLP